MVNYPGSLDNDSTLYLVVDNVDDYLAAHHNSLKDAIIAVQTALGITGSFNFALTSHTQALHTITDPVGNTTWSLSNESLKLQFPNNIGGGMDGGLEIEAIGVFTGDLVHIHQHTGAVGAVTLLHVESVDTDVTPVKIVGTGTNSLDVTGNIAVSGNVDGKDVAGHVDAGNPHSTSASDTDLSNHAGATATHGVAQIANHAEIGTQIGTHAALTATHGVSQIADNSNLHAEAHALATSGPHTGTLPLTDLVVGTAGGIIRRGAADWEELAKADDGDVLTLTSGYPVWETPSDYEASLMIGSGNAAWIPCVFELPTDLDKLKNSGMYIYNYATGGTNAVWNLPIPTNRGGLKLYLAESVIGLANANGTNYVNARTTGGVLNGTGSAIDTNTTDITTTGRTTDNFGGAIDVSGYDKVGMQLQLTFANISGLYISEVAFKCYYDT